jgi:hypothetical protein
MEGVTARRWMLGLTILLAIGLAAFWLSGITTVMKGGLGL